jgi:hypothetical protein
MSFSDLNVELHLLLNAVRERQPGARLLKDWAHQALVDGEADTPEEAYVLAVIRYFYKKRGESGEK